MFGIARRIQERLTKFYSRSWTLGCRQNVSQFDCRFVCGRLLLGNHIPDDGLDDLLVIIHVGCRNSQGCRDASLEISELYLRCATSLQTLAPAFL